MVFFDVWVDNVVNIACDMLNVDNLNDLKNKMKLDDQTLKQKQREAEVRRTVGKLIVGASAAYAVTSTAMLAYKLGLFHEFLPAAWTKKIDDVAEKVAKRTEPVLRSPPAAVGFLARVYGHLAGAVIANCAGAYIFERMPFLPLALPVLGTVVPSAVLLVVRSKNMLPEARLALYYGSAISMGYVLAPLNIVTTRSMSRVAIASTATAVGFSVTALITRGKISFFCGAQTLSAALTILGLVASNNVAIDRLHDVDSLLTFQVMVNIALTVSHAVPVFAYFGAVAKYAAQKQEAELAAAASQKGSGDVAAAAAAAEPKKAKITAYTGYAAAAFGIDDEAVSKDEQSKSLPADVAAAFSSWIADFDYLKQAKIIHSVGIYLCWWAFKKVTVLVLRQMKMEPTLSRARSRLNSILGAQTDKKAGTALGLIEDADRIADVLGSIVFFLLYLKFVAAVQRAGNTVGTLGKVGSVYNMLNPLAWI